MTMSRRTRAEQVMQAFGKGHRDEANVANALREAVEGFNIEPNPDRELSIEKNSFITGQLWVKDAIIRLANELDGMVKEKRETKMTIKTTDLLDLLAYAGELDLSIFVKKDKDGDYVVKFYELYTNNFDEAIIINKEGEVEWCNGDTCSFEYLMDTFVDMLSKAQKRQELLNRLTDEELELLGVVK